MNYQIPYQTLGSIHDLLIINDNYLDSVIKSNIFIFILLSFIYLYFHAEIDDKIGLLHNIIILD